MNPAPILTALLALPAWEGDRALTAEEREAQLAPVAAAIGAVARNRDEAAWLVAQGKHESHFASLVLQGRCSEMPKGQQCDPKHGVPQSRGPWQLKGRWCRTVDTLEGQAACALRLARWGLKQCGTWEAAFAAQRGMGACTSPQAPKREATRRKVLAAWGAKR